MLISMTLLFSSNAFAADPISYIIGGDDATVGDYPWMVALYKSDDFTCGGVQISSHWIATAAHCVYQDDDDDGNATAYDASYFKVIIGESTHYSTTSAASTSGVTVHAIKSVIINPDYTGSSSLDSSSDTDYDYDYDIALLELDEAYYQAGPAIATADRFDEISENDYLTVIGFGVMSTDDDATADETIPTTLQEAQLPFVPTSECYWNDYGMISDNMFCAGYSDGTSIESCSGDSGGPIFTILDGELTLVGLVSWGPSTCSTVPSVFTKVSNLRSWILENIDGYQVVEEGDARYNSDEGTYSDGLISVYYYNSNDDVDDEFIIGDLDFDSDDYSNTLSVINDCSGYTLNDSGGSCAIDFSLIDAISEDDEFSASLSITPSTSAGVQTYSLNFVADLTTNDDLTYTSTSDDSDDDDDDDDSSSSSSGSFGFIFLLLMTVLAWVRLSFFHCLSGKKQ